MSFIAALPAWGLIHASGPDAQGFLHGQLTNDLLSLAPGEVQWSGYCTAKGRMLACFLVWRDRDRGFYLTCERALVASLVKRLRMYVLRAKVVIEDVSERYAALGIWVPGATPQPLPMRVDCAGEAPLAGAGHAGATQSAGSNWAEAPQPVWRITLPAVDGGTRTLLWTASPDTARTTVASGLSVVDAPAWMRLMVRAGEGWISAATQEAFVPQMINFDVLGGINFKKGCYPGQEIVARAHYRGAVKRRMYLATVDAPAKAGDVLYASDLDGQESGTVVLAAPCSASSGVDPGAEPGASATANTPTHTDASELLAVLPIQSHAAAEIRLGAPDGPLLRFTPLPYALPAAV